MSRTISQSDRVSPRVQQLPEFQRTIGTARKLAAHADHRVELSGWQVGQPFGVVRRQVVADLAHVLNGAWVDSPRGARAGTVRLDLAVAVNACERLGHLTPVGVLDADEKHSFHEQASFGGETTRQQQSGACTHRHASTPAQAPSTGAGR